jgi:hypothetical protein
VGKSLSEAKEPFIFGIIRMGRFQFVCAKTVIQENDSIVITQYAEQEGEAACI